MTRRRPRIFLLVTRLALFPILLLGCTVVCAAADRQPALHQAARAGDTAALKNELSRGADPNLRDADGRTALFEAASAGNAEILKVLLSAGANPDLASFAGRTPLIEATAQNRIEAVKVLVKAGADLNRSQRGDGSALEVGERSGYREIAALLRSAGARTSGKSIGDTVCVRPWDGNGYCGVVEDVNSQTFLLKVTKLVGCSPSCQATPCSENRPVGAEGLNLGDTITVESWCLTHTGVKP